MQSGAAFDAAHTEVRGALDTCEVIGWHCTRLTDAEIALIEADGMQLPNVQMLNERIDRLIERFLWAKGLFDPEPEIPEGYTVAPIEAGSIKRVIRHPDFEFMRLTGCKNWHTPI